MVYQVVWWDETTHHIYLIIRILSSHDFNLKIIQNSEEKLDFVENSNFYKEEHRKFDSKFEQESRFVFGFASVEVLGNNSFWIEFGRKYALLYYSGRMLL